ncbi:MAG: HAD-IA family hydrolase [Acidobacteria bacterium]|nr:HAD-IA family hydrolase [Acidobacteriota bacterium]
MKKTQAILFDLDGTLIDTTDLILRCFDHTWQSVCGITHSRENILATFGIPLRQAMHQLLIHAEAAAALAIIPPTDAYGDEPHTHLVEQLLLTYRAYNIANHDALAKPFAHTAPVIGTLRARGYAIGVVTSKGRELAQRGLQLCALDGLIDEAIFMEDTVRHKPAPEPLLAALERLQVNAAAAAYVGDSFHDIVAGRAAGVTTIAAAWGPMPRAELERQGPDVMAESISDLLTIFV